MKTIPHHTINYIDDWLQFRYPWSEYPGYAVAIMKDGKLVFNKTYGYANLETKEPLATDHLFRVASQSKTFTATAILQLYEQKALRLDDPVITYLPWLKDHKDKRWRDVTIRQVLSHGAGIIRDGKDARFWQLQAAFPSDAELKKSILSSRLVLDPNQKMKYSNFGFGLLGMIVESASGQSYDDYVASHIFKPLGLKHVTTDYDPHQKMVSGYSAKNLDQTRFTLPEVPTNALRAATGFCSNASDMASFFSHLMLGSGALLSDQSKRLMQQDQWHAGGDEGWYGLGLDRMVWGGSTVYGHSGGFPTGVSRTVFDQDSGLTISVLVNCTGAWPMQMARSIMSVINLLGHKEPDEDLLNYETRTASFFGPSDYVATDKGLVHIWSNSWSAFDSYETLKKHGSKKHVFLIQAADAYYSDSEETEFMFDKVGKLTTVVDAGMPSPPSVTGEIQATWK